MKISVKKTHTGIFAVSFNGTIHTLGPHDLKRLVLEAVRALTPGALPDASALDEALELATHLHALDDTALQAIVIVAVDRDLVMFLKGMEGDAQLQERIFANMSERRRKILSEELAFRFQHEGALDDAALRDAVARLADAAHRHRPAPGRA